MNQPASRRSGLLLHPTSLPGPGGIGDLGPAAYSFLDWAAQAGQRLWQVLPLGPTGFGDSPYASFSTFAGNPLLVSLDRLAGQGEFHLAVVPAAPETGPEAVDFGLVTAWKLPLLLDAARYFLRSAATSRRSLFEEFCQVQSWWLEDFALFMAIKIDQQRRGAHHDGPWNTAWDPAIARRETPALLATRARLAREIEMQKVCQFHFFEQWQSLREHARQRGIGLVGDLPIFVAGDSADVWSRPDLFLLDPHSLAPRFVAGVPGDAFQADGQLWGNPQYDWQAMQRDRFAWWVRRVRHLAGLVDLIRVDHFRGFEKSWFVAGGLPTARTGEWASVPGRELFQQLRTELGSLPLIAEDLGIIDENVDRLREDFGLPGMRVLQFAFDPDGGRSRLYLPHNHIRNCVVYTGTHDNDTSAGWWQTLAPEARRMAVDYLGGEPADPAWAMIRLAMSSVADTAILPMQDVLGLGSPARMNFPGTSRGNWKWRMAPDALTPELAQRLGRKAELYDRA